MVEKNTFKFRPSPHLCPEVLELPRPWASRAPPPPPRAPCPSSGPRYRPSMSSVHTRESIFIILEKLNNSLIYIFPVATSPPISPCTVAAWPRPPPRLPPPALARHRQTASIPRRQRRPSTGKSSQQDENRLLLLSRYLKTLFKGKINVKS